jgi:transposase InsO family protein
MTWDELIHLDIKKLGRIGSVGHRITGRSAGVVNRHHGIGWEFVHVSIDDASRIAFVRVMPDQRKQSAVVFLEAAVAYFAKLGVRLRRVITDNGSCYRSQAFKAACVPQHDRLAGDQRLIRRQAANRRGDLGPR